MFKVWYCKVGIEMLPQSCYGKGTKGARLTVRDLFDAYVLSSQVKHIWKVLDQIRAYHEQIPDLFQYNEILVISDGSQARMGGLSSNAERFMQWRTIDGTTLDPLDQFNELETLVRGLLAPDTLLDYLIMAF